MQLRNRNVSDRRKRRLLELQRRRLLPKRLNVSRLNKKLLLKLKLRHRKRQQRLLRKVRRRKKRLLPLMRVVLQMLKIKKTTMLVRNQN